MLAWGEKVDTFAVIISDIAAMPRGSAVFAHNMPLVLNLLPRLPEQKGCADEGALENCWQEYNFSTLSLNFVLHLNNCYTFASIIIDGYGDDRRSKCVFNTV